MANENENINVISNQEIPSIPPNPLNNNNEKNNMNFIDLSISSEDIHKHKKIMTAINNEITSYHYVSMIFVVILIILIGILINDINCKVLNMYYNTNKYNDNIIVKMLIV